MRRHEFQLAPGREDTRRERRLGRHGSELYQFEERASQTDDMIVLCVAHHGRSLAPEDRDLISRNQSIDSGSAKRVYLEAMQMLLRDRLQSTWGRVQQKAEMEYEPIVEAILKRLRSRLTRINGNVLEEFEGFVDQFEGDAAHVTLKTQTGEMFYGEYPAADLKAHGVRERRRFRCWTVEVGSGVEFVMEPLPDRELSEEREREIDQWLRNSLGDDDARQNDK
jgi:hypothetical protein